MQFLSEAYRILRQQIIFPPLQECSLCHKLIVERIDIGICPDCRQKLPWLSNTQCIQSSTSSLAPNLGLDGHRALFAYQDQGKELILNYKYRFQPSLAKTFAILWKEKQQYCFDWQDEPIITYVPMTLKREKERGYHSALCLAEALAKETGLTVRHMLNKVRQPPEQHHLNREERWQALEGVYQMRRGQIVKSGSWLLVDDVYTTGATLHHCATALKEAGAKQVYALTVAFTLEKLSV